MASPNHNNISRDGGSSKYSHNMRSYLQSKGQVNYNVLESDEVKNPKYKYFQKVGMRRPEAIAKNSIALNNDWNNTAFSAIEQDKTFADLMYSTASEDKPGRLKDYRQMAAFSEVADALDEICDEMINLDDNDEIVKLKFKNCDLDSVKKEEIEKQFSKFINHLELEEHGWRYFRQFLEEGELFFELIVKDNYLNQGIVAIKNLPAEQFDPVYDNIQTMLVKAFIYKKPIFSVSDHKKIDRYELIPFDKNQVLYVNSGQYNETKEFVIPFIENCRRAYRQLSMIEDSVVIHRMVHAPLRFVFNVDVGRLPVPQAERYLRQLQSQYWSTKTFDADGGDVVKKYSPQSTMDSFWFAKRQGQEATTVQEFGGQPSDGNLDVLDWFIKKLYRSLKTPTSRLNSETNFNDGTEMLREELKFAKMIIRQQQRFAAGIKKAFVTHLRFRGEFEDYDLYEENLHVSFNVPTNFYDLRENQKMELKINTFNNITSNEGVSVTWAMKKYLDLKDRDILANREFQVLDAAHMYEVQQTLANGPGWRQLLKDQAEAGGEADLGGDMGGGGGGGLPAVPDFNGGPVDTSEGGVDAADAPEVPPNEPAPQG